ncbi:helix-hairpin-helix domain-containing protein [Streptomyces sp. TLI_105]|uniref:helix-hairpin-helix domain-containing protein n=1 Tax=Streptomyces sp. TLI_105 TaxID=1881019 RepID=UPI00089600ED|nr:helix-hairpin-helix domain-containing protein [Streptomyces sp. TLI_105]SED72748.1 ATP-dependent exoDNAse (exonuclease V), alpha subunit, helicase superfamily I [Streptomyces sp. TLI_105]
MTEPSGETAPEAAEPTEDLREEAAEPPAPDAAEGPDSTEEPAEGPGTTEEPGTGGEPDSPERPAAAEEPRTAEGPESAEEPDDRTATVEEPEPAGEPEPAEEPDSRTATAEEPGSAEETGDRSAVGEGAGAVEGADGSELSEAQAELAAQRELRARIEARKAEKSGPVTSGAKLSGTAADLLAAVRAVEGGTSSGSAFYEAPEPAPRRPAVETTPATTVRPPAPERPTAPAPGTTAAVREVLAAGGAPEALAGRVAAVLGEGAAPALREDPWQLLAVPGVRPEQADGFARALLGPACGPGDPRRAVALTVWLLERAAVQGHTALEVQAVCAGLAGHAVPDPEQAVEAAVSEGAVLLFQEEETAEEPEGDEDVEEAPVPAAEREPAAPALLGLDRYAMAEESLADGLARLVRTAKADVWEGGELERAAGANGLVLHTGGEAARAEPVALAAAARERGLRTLVAVHADGGRRALGAAGAEAVTVAALLSGAAGPGRDEDGAFALDLLVVLDAPQLDVETGAMLVESLPDGCRLVLSGDPEVLGAPGAGRVFADVLASRVCPRIASRVPDPGPLGELVSGIGAGELNQVEAPGKEVVIVPVRDAGEAVHRTVQLVADSVPRALGVPSEQTQVVTVGHGGSAGTRALNAALKQRLNPGPGRFGGYDPGDRVAYAPAPGRTVTGTVLSADAEGLRLRCGRDELLVPKDRVESALRHGWALTAHQAAGTRWPAVVVVLPGDAAGGLSRPWVYTAFGRAERHLSVVHGVDQALPRAVAEGVAPERTTRLRPLLEALLAVDGE